MNYELFTLDPVTSLELFTRLLSDRDYQGRELDLDLDPVAETRQSLNTSPQ